MTGNMKNTSKFLKEKCDFYIANDEGDGKGSIQTMNKTDTFVELKNKHWANFLVDIEKTIKSNSRKSRVKVRGFAAITYVLLFCPLLLQQEMSQVTVYGSDLLILSAYAPSMPPLLSLPLSIVYDNSDGCVMMVIGS
ncbi:hypothetical protein Tco_0810818 [Tanacetum coccineum]